MNTCLLLDISQRINIFWKHHSHLFLSTQILSTLTKWLLCWKWRRVEENWWWQWKKTSGMGSYYFRLKHYSPSLPLENVSTRPLQRYKIFTIEMPVQMYIVSSTMSFSVIRPARQTVTSVYASLRIMYHSDCGEEPRHSQSANNNDRFNPFIHPFPVTPHHRPMHHFTLAPNSANQ